MEKFKKLLRFDLQLFADDEGGEDPKDSEVKDQEPERSNLKYSDEDLNRIIDKKFAEWKVKHDRDVDEATKLAQMDEKKKAEYERDKLQKELDELKRAQNISEMSKVARGILSEESINVSDNLIANLIHDDAESTKKSVDDFIKEFKKAVSDAVTAELKGTPPKRGEAGNGLTKEKIMAVKSAAERQKLIKENMDLFK